MNVPESQVSTVDRDFAVAWYQSWIDAWNSHEPDRVKAIVTDDFVLDSPTTRHTGWEVRGQQAASDYVRYVITAYPDLIWEVTAPPMFRDDIPRAAFSWRGTGHFSGRLDPPGIPGTGRPEHMTDNVRAGFGVYPDAAMRKRMADSIEL